MNRSDLIRDIKHWLFAIPNWIGHNVHNTYGILNVFYLMWWKPMKGGLVKKDHPFVTGLIPETGESVWKKNIIFRSKRNKKIEATVVENDEVIVSSVLRYISKMVEVSSVTKQFPNGRPSRMPPAVNYIHGTVHYNGVTFVFNDSKDALAHFTDPDFRAEFWKFFWNEKREPTIVLRNRNEDRETFKTLSCFMKTSFPFFGNPNFNKGRIHWGTPSPYPVFNLICGWWINPTRKLRHKKNHHNILRPALVSEVYFQKETYIRGRENFLAPERFWTWFTDLRIDLRGNRGGVYFTDKRKLDSGFKYDPRELITLKSRMIEKLF
jgi:hypothetical protein